MNFRAAAGRQVHRENTGLATGFSNFSFVDKWFGAHPVMRRIFSLARKRDFQSLVVDLLSESDCALLAQENVALAIRRPDFQKSEAYRVAFFRSPKEQTPAATNDFLGYVVFKKDYFANDPKLMSHVYEAVIDAPRTAEQNNFVQCRRVYTVNTSLGVYPVSGVLYAQQNDLTFVCAHVALRSALAAILPGGDVDYAQMNSLMGIDHKTRSIGGGVGLRSDDIEKLLGTLNVHFSKVVNEPSQNLILPTDYQRDLYGFIESGWPALVVFELEKPVPGTNHFPRHMIPVVGHTFNEDTWMPDAERAYFGGNLGYYPSENWLSTFVVHDDNFGPYYCLPRLFLKKDNFRLMYGLKRCATEFEAVDAEAAGFSLFLAISRSFPKLNLDWYDRFSVFTKFGWVVLRTLLVSRSEYIGHITALRDRSGASLEPDVVKKLDGILPSFLWMVEASAPELFSGSRRKFGELLLTADKPMPKPLNPSVLLAARLPGFVLMSGSLTVTQTILTGHTDLYRFPSP